MKIIIEHLDPEVFPWSLLEYTHIKKICGGENVVFTNVKEGANKLTGFLRVEGKSVKELIGEFGRVCILDPKAKKELTATDADSFDYFLFGGVLGNHPMDGRTELELSNQLPMCETRHLGEMQMSTDTAVLVTHKIIDEKKKFSDLAFQDEIEILLDDGFSNILPYRYVLDENGQPILPEGLVEYLKEEDESNQW